MHDFRELKMFIRPGREAVQKDLDFLAGHWPITALVPVFQTDMTLAENVGNLAKAARMPHQGQRFDSQLLYLYSGDNGLLVLFGLANQWQQLQHHLNRIIEHYHHDSFVFCDGHKASLRHADLKTREALPDYDGSLESLDALAGYLIAGWQTEGQFNGSMSFVQMRDHQTRLKE